METSPSVNSSIRSILIAIGGIGVAKGWWDQAGMEELVNQLMVFGGSSMVIGAAIWGVWAKRAASKEAKAITSAVMSERAKDAG